MIALDITPAERASGTMTPEHLDVAIRAIAEDGFVVLDNVINLSELALLREKMLADLPLILERKDAPYNWHTGNVQHDPPPVPPYLFRDILLNDMVIAVTKAVLGDGVKNSLYSGNTAMPGGKEQPVHVDTGQLWPNLEVAPPAFSIVVNVPLVAMDARNGSTEIWPGTHLDTTKHVFDPDIKLSDQAVGQHRAVRPPLQPSVREGSILLRDIRLWHRGMPNHTEIPRPMIAMIHSARWWEAGGPMLFPKGAEEFFAGSELKTVARFVDDPIDYIHQSHAYEYEKQR